MKVLKTLKKGNSQGTKAVIDEESYIRQQVTSQKTHTFGALVP